MYLSSGYSSIQMKTASYKDMVVTFSCNSGNQRKVRFRSANGAILEIGNYVFFSHDLMTKIDYDKKITIASRSQTDFDPTLVTIAKKLFDCPIYEVKNLQLFIDQLC